MGLSSIRTTRSGDEVVGTLAKIKGFIPEEQRKTIELKAGRFVIDTSPWVGSSHSIELANLLETAMEKTCLVHFAYSDHKLSQTIRTVEPYRLILKVMSWYLEGYCLKRKDFRIFKLSRMSEVALIDERFEPRPFNPQPLLQPAFPEAEKALPALLRIHERAIDPIIDEFGPDCIEQESENTWLARVFVLDNEQGYKSLLKLGADCECLAPECLRENFVQYLAQLSSVYAPPIPERGEG